VDDSQSQLYEYETFFSADGGPVREITPTNCSIAPGGDITLDPTDPTHATSSVICGNCTFFFDHTVSDVTGTWTTIITSSGCNVSCLYAYTDYDIYTSSGVPNDASFQSGGGGFTGQFVVRNSVTMPEVEYLFVDQTGASHWQQDPYPTLRSLLLGLQACTDLSDNPPTMSMSDYTGAFQYTIDPPGDAFVVQVHSRDDTTPFP
jgi:hypothetical protein